MDEIEQNNPRLPDTVDSSLTKPADFSPVNQKTMSQPSHSESTTLEMPEPESPLKKPPARTKHLNLLGANSVAFYINNLEDPLIVQFGQQISLGRRSEATGLQPSVDLAPYNAFAFGVSRLHATIRRLEHTLIFEDHDSSNGSMINGERIRPYAARTLKSGDLIVLGKLNMEIYFLAQNDQLQGDNLESEWVPAPPNRGDLNLILDGLPPLTPQLVDLSQSTAEPQTLTGTLEIHDPSRETPYEVVAEITINLKKSDSQQSPVFEVVVSAEVNESEQPINDLLSGKMKLTGFTLTLK